MSMAASMVLYGCWALMSSAAAAAAAGGKKSAPAVAAAKGGKEPMAAATKPKATKKKGPVDPNNLHERPVPVSDALRKFGGAAHISRSSVLKIVWD